MADDTTLIAPEDQDMAPRPKGDPTRMYHWRLPVSLVEALDEILDKNPPRGIDKQVDLIKHALWKFVDEHPTKRSR